MEHPNQSMLTNLSDVIRLSDSLRLAVVTIDRANIIRICSYIQNRLSDLTEEAITDCSIIDVEP